MQLHNFGLQYNDVGGKNLEKSPTSTIVFKIKDTTNLPFITLSKQWISALFSKRFRKYDTSPPG